MKRSAAIIGPTPQFVRWAIAHRCSLRELELDDLPDSTFRQLRGIRVLSAGLADGRVFEQICVHDSVSPATNARDARGFPIAEILNLVGGQQHLDHCCNSCPANASDEEAVGWAGCYGWLPADLSWSLATDGSSDKGAKIKEDLPPILDAVIQSRLMNQYESKFGKCRPWYGLWRDRVLDQGQLGVLNSALEMAMERTSVTKQIRHLWDATVRCLQFGKDLHVELVPPGYSNGSAWTVLAHCPKCNCATQKDNVCCGCHRRGNLVEGRKFKVLGFRPYLLLRNILGEPETIQFVKRYLEWKKMTGGRSSSDQQSFEKN